MSYYFVIIFCIIIILIASYTHSQTYNEHFSQQFFQVRKHPIYIGIDNTQIMSNDITLINTIEKFTLVPLNTVYITHTLDKYPLLNNNQIQFVLAKGNDIYNLTHKISDKYEQIPYSNIRFVCALHSIPISILTTQMYIAEFSQLKNSKLRVNVGTYNSSTHLLTIDLINQYQLTVDQDIFLTYYDNTELYQQYGKTVDVAIIVDTHPSTLINTLTNLIKSKLIEIKEYNDGDIYHITLKEKPFYDEYPYYQKYIVDKDRLMTYYTKLAINEDNLEYQSHKSNSYRSKFINTVCVKYYLMTNTSVTSKVISQLLYDLKLHLNEINNLKFIEDKLNTSSLNDYSLSIDYHDGARLFFTNAGLVTNINEVSCIMINGRCDYQQLHDHHLLEPI